MPNHCESDLLVTGPSGELKRFMEFAKGSAGVDNPREGETATEALLSAGRFIPYPAEFKTGQQCPQCGWTSAEEPQERGFGVRCPTCAVFTQDGYNRGGYEWCVKNWGTKWGLYEVRLENQDTFEDPEEHGSLEYSFQSAWSPPGLVIKEMGRQFPLLAFDLSYYECGAAYQGKLLVEGGEVKSQWSGEYHGNRGG